MGSNPATPTVVRGRGPATAAAGRALSDGHVCSPTLDGAIRSRLTIYLLRSTPVKSTVETLSPTRVRLAYRPAEDEYRGSRSVGLHIEHASL